MRKILCLILSLVLLFSLCACAKDKDKNTDSDKYVHSVDIAYYASLGKIPELQFALGANPDDIMNAAKHDEESHNDVSSDVGHVHEAPDIVKTEGELSVLLNDGAFLYMYEKEKSDKGISAIVCLEKGYDLEIGSYNVTEDLVKKALSKHTPTISKPNQDDLFFLPDVGDDATSLDYIFNGKYKIQFVFINETFSAIILSDIQNWTI